MREHDMSVCARIAGIARARDSGLARLTEASAFIGTRLLLANNLRNPRVSPPLSALPSISAAEGEGNGGRSGKAKKRKRRVNNKSSSSSRAKARARIQCARKKRAWGCAASFRRPLAWAGGGRRADLAQRF